ncbi:3-hydroxybutyryl-CoA dehydrogenase [Catenulispora sp. EB89]|uniref:3-hydroxybutyryl-CoA dehydrogenase n=1 Tax=Catenulispora sp. EB89 TaxID=3156257 RepID=UPI0035117ACD
MPAAEPDGVHLIGVVGCGQMGAGIAEVCARAGFEVVVAETGPATAAAGRARVEASLARALDRGKITDRERDNALDLISVTTDFDRLSDRDLVIEAVADGVPAAEPDGVHLIGVVGCGQMGAGIAEVCARAGFEVVVAETGPATAAAGRARVEASLARALDRGKITDRERDNALDLISVTTDFDRLSDRDLVIEAVAEHEAAKLAVFARLDATVRRRDAILATNTSSIPVIRLATATSRPEHVIGMHFFNPVPVLSLVELVPSLATDPETEVRATRFVAGALGKEVIRARDRAGFIVNALLIPYLLSATRMLESGMASVQDIDRGMVLGCAYPLGPLALADLIGLDTVKAIAESMYTEFKDPQYSPPPLLARMVEAGHLGRKTGRGFHSYG